jgi:hypothetical protein
MTAPLRRTDSGDDEDTTPTGRTWLSWLQQSASLVYFVGGTFLIYQYWARLNRRIVLITGILFVLYGLYRFHLVRRSSRARRR